jgi:hypothetical protein
MQALSPCSEYTLYPQCKGGGALRRFLGNDCRLRRIELLYALAPAGKEFAALRDGPVTASK